MLYTPLMYDDYITIKKKIASQPHRHSSRFLGVMRLVQYSNSMLTSRGHWELTLCAD